MAVQKLEKGSHYLWLNKPPVAKISDNNVENV